jgi:hypothetical protein
MCVNARSYHIILRHVHCSYLLPSKSVLQLQFFSLSHLLAALLKPRHILGLIYGQTAHPVIIKPKLPAVAVQV